MLINNIDYNISFSKTYGMIFLNFVNDKFPYFGCANNCSFCSWRAIDYSRKLCPTNEDIIAFIQNILPQCKAIQLSGGGDPLYCFKKNKNELLRIINCVKSQNIKDISIITREYNIVSKYWNNELSDINCWSFSTQYLNKQLKELITSLLKAEKKVIISYILNVSNNINWEIVENFLCFYNIPGLIIILRQNFNKQNLNLDLKQKLREIRAKSNIKSKIRFAITLENLNHLCLMNNEVWHTKTIQKKLINLSNIK